MSELKIYGTMMSRAARVIWMAEELGIDYSLERVNVHKGEQFEGGYDVLNPNAKVPSIQDGDFVLWESLAINLYLAKKHGGPLAPKTAEDEARAVQWSMWALTEAEDNAVILIQKALGIHDHSEEAVSNAFEALKKPLAVVEKILSGQDYLLGSEFTVADLNVACVLGTLPRSNIDISEYPKTEAWLKSCVERPGSQRMGKLRAAAMKA